MRGRPAGDDVRHDVALVAVEGTASAASDWLASAPSEAPPTGAWVGTLASTSYAQELVGVQGAVGPPGQAFGDEPLPLLVLDLRVLAGMSGAPLFDRQSRLVGMLVKKTGEFSLAVPVRK